MAGAAKSGLQTLPPEVIDLIVDACKDEQVFNRAELQGIGTVCRSLRYSVLPLVYENLAFCTRDGRWKYFITFTEFIGNHPSCGRHVKRIVAEILQSYTRPPLDAKMVPSLLSPTTFTLLEHLELPNQYLLPAIAAIPTDSSPFPNLKRIRFHAPLRYGNPKITRLQVPLEKFQVVWKSPKLEAVRLVETDILSSNTANEEDLAPVGTVSLSKCSITGAALQELTNIRPIEKLDVYSCTIDPYPEAIRRVYETDLGHSVSLGFGPPIALFVDLRRLSLTDEQLHEVATGDNKLPPGLPELEIAVDTLNRERANFLTALHEVVEQQTPVLVTLNLTLECEVPHQYEEDERSDDSDNSDNTPPTPPTPRSPVLLLCNQGDWDTGYPRYSCNDLEIREPEPGRDGAVGLSARKLEDYKQFEGYSELKEFCEGKGITLRCEWTVREYFD